MAGASQTTKSVADSLTEKEQNHEGGSKAKSNAGSLTVTVKEKMQCQGQNSETGMATNESSGSEKPFKFSYPMRLEEIRQVQSSFVRENKCSELQTPKDIILALTASVGKIADMVAWDECKAGLEEWSEEKRHTIGGEMSDAVSYILRLADHCHIIFPMEIIMRFGALYKKYPQVPGKELRGDVVVDVPIQ